MSCPANVSTNVTSQEFSELGQEESRSLELEVWPWVVKFVQWSMCVVGMVGNWSVVVVYKTKKSFNRTASENFILLMAVFDLSMCLLTLFFTASQQYLLPLNCFLFCASGNFSFDFINTSSSMLMIVITLNRWVPNALDLDSLTITLHNYGSYTKIFPRSWQDLGKPAMI